MSQVSKRLLAPKVSNRIFEIFLKSISKLKDKDEIVEFLEDFLSTTERVMLSKRLSIAFLLANGYDYRTITTILKVSKGTVWSVAMSYNLGGGYKRQVSKIMRDEEIKLFLLDIADMISKIGGVGGKGSTGWRSVNRNIKKKKYDKPF
ncbi:hypothetical protein A2125_01085 [Candidatus Woesebacteria bacterium GWB1_43_5]|uniref:TrpR like protein, YerC/YecD n=1 Tax=Candidatus Woesebacteria bacterium GWB1_43_5 TaxID=1802474 RepID=A0A1F7WSF8_9BACT|nr:MAG: hypothetical protein A2125_01085 [Candidatus Woesebacteria bacterium GWB1_43_5]